MKTPSLESERLDVAHNACSRLLALLKSDHGLVGKKLEQMKLVEQAVSCLEAARIIGVK